MPRILFIVIGFTLTPFFLLAQVCNNWLYLPAYPEDVEIGQLNITGNQLTIEAMINMTAPFTGGPTIGSDIVTKYRDPTDVNYLLRVQNAQITTSTGFHVTPSVCDPVLNQTYHIAMVYDGVALKYYRNGMLMSQTPATGNLVQNSWPAEIGNYFSKDYNTQFIGYINEVRIWNVARTQAQLQTYMSSPLPNPTAQTGLLAYYNFGSLVNQQGNAAWNGTKTTNALINQVNPNCTPAAVGTLAGNIGCTTPATLTFHSSAGSGPFTVVYSDGSQVYTRTGVMDGVAFPVQVQPVATTTYSLISIQAATDCQPQIAPTGVSATITPGSGFTADFAFSQQTCNPHSVQFQASAPAGSTYAWNINGTPYTATDPADPTLSFTFPSDGVYPVTLTASAGAGCGQTVAKSINIAVQPADLIITPDTGICVGTQATLRTKPMLDFCWSPTSYLDNPSSATPTAKPPVTTKYTLTAKTLGANLITNGDFESGNTGFSSAYTYQASGLPEGVYWVGGDPHTWNPGAPTGCGDHTTGKGNMMIINGATVSGVNVWSSQTLTVTPNTNYAFSIWIQSVSPLAPAILQFSINGKLLGPVVNASSTTCNWQNFYTTWNSGSNTTAKIDLVNENTALSGNDFALDDISFAPVTLQTEAVTVDVETPAVTASPATTTVCPNTAVPLLASGSQTYAWSPATGLSAANIDNPVFQLPASAAGTTSSYTVTGTSARGCIATAMVTLTLYPQLLSITPDTLICKGDGAQLYATGGGTYAWSPAASLDNAGSATPVAHPGADTRYNLVLTDINHCTEQGSVTVRIKPVPVFYAPPDQGICKGIGVPLKSANGPGYIYQWSPATGLSDPSAPYPVATPPSDITYTLDISDSVCAAYKSSFAVHVKTNTSPVVEATKANDIDCSVHTSQLSVSGAFSYQWTPATGLDDPNSTNPVATIDSTTTYTVAGTSEDGCTGYGTVTVFVTKSGANTFVVPNAFTPNGDGHNDCFGISRWGDVQLIEMAVYNRWGIRVFSTRNPSDCWDGTFKGKPAETGAYPYVIRARTICGEVTRTGLVMLIR